MNTEIEKYDTVSSFALTKKDQNDKYQMHKMIVFEIRDYHNGVLNVVFRYFLDGNESDFWNLHGFKYTPTSRYDIDHGRWVWQELVSKGWQKAT